MHFETVETSATTRNNSPTPALLANGRRVVCRQRFFDKKTKRWSKTWINHVLCPDNPPTATPAASPVPCLTIKLAMGGTINIQCNAISVEQSQDIKEEMLNNVVRRRYPVENKFEPRVHSLYHTKATTEGDEHDKELPQPSYSYGSARMKAYPLSRVPHIQDFYHHVVALCKKANGCNGEFDELAAEEIAHFFNIGVDAIIYRDGWDAIGFHADNDQWETLILTLVVDCPGGPRRIVVQPNKNVMAALKAKEQDDDDEPPVQQIELFLGACDLYTMDEAMQKNYVHGVPADANQAGEGKQRLALVFRRGREQYSKVDSGTAISNLTPEEKTIPYSHGPVLKPREYPANMTPRMAEALTMMRWKDPNETNLFQYGDVVERNLMIDWRGHSSEQGGVSGNKLFGCDSIVLSQKRVRHEVSQAFFYKATSRQGAMALVESFHSQHAVRVWRSNSHDLTIRLAGRGKKSSQVYRYDGLAELINYKRPESPGGDFIFLMCMMYWDGQNNNDPPLMDDYDRLRLLRLTPSGVLDEVNDLAKLVAELKARPKGDRSYRIPGTIIAAEEDGEEDAAQDYEEDVSDYDEDDVSNDDEEDVAQDDDKENVSDDDGYVLDDGDKESVDEAMQEGDTVRQDPVPDANVRSGKHSTTTATSRSRKRRNDGCSNGPTRTRIKWSVKQKKKLLNETIADAEKEFNKKREETMSRLPPEFRTRIGDIGVAKIGKKKFAVLVCHPYDVPPEPVRKDWLHHYFKGKRTSHAIVYWYGQTKETRMYGYPLLSSIQPYSGPEKGLSLKKTAREQLQEDLMKDPFERRRGIAEFLEGYQTIGMDDVEETLGEWGDD